jgi:DNA topoisomerase IB
MREMREGAVRQRCWAEMRASRATPRVTLDFKGKGGKKIKQEVRDPLLARIARRVPSLAATSTNCPKRANSYGSDATHRPEKVGSQRKFADSSLKLNQLRLNRR